MTDFLSRLIRRTAVADTAVVTPVLRARFEPPPGPAAAMRDDLGLGEVRLRASMAEPLAQGQPIPLTTLPIKPPTAPTTAPTTAPPTTPTATPLAFGRNAAGRGLVTAAHSVPGLGAVGALASVESAVAGANSAVHTVPGGVGRDTVPGRTVDGAVLLDHQAPARPAAPAAPERPAVAAEPGAGLAPAQALAPPSVALPFDARIPGPRVPGISLPVHAAAPPLAWAAAGTPPPVHSPAAVAAITATVAATATSTASTMALPVPALVITQRAATAPIASLPPASPPASTRAAPPDVTPAIQVTIGRIEVRAPREADAAPQPPKPAPRVARVSLDDYLQRIHKARE